MNRNNDAFPMFCFGKNMVATIDALQLPAMFLNKTDKFFTGNLFHITKRRESTYADHAGK